MLVVALKLYLLLLLNSILPLSAYRRLDPDFVLIVNIVPDLYLLMRGRHL